MEESKVENFSSKQNQLQRFLDDSLNSYFVVESQQITSFGRNYHDLQNSSFVYSESRILNPFKNDMNYSPLTDFTPKLERQMTWASSLFSSEKFNGSCKTSEPDSSPYYISWSYKVNEVDQTSALMDSPFSPPTNFVHNDGWNESHEFVNLEKNIKEQLSNRRGLSSFKIESEKTQAITTDEDHSIVVARGNVVNNNVSDWVNFGSEPESGVKMDGNDWFGASNFSSGTRLCKSEGRNLTGRSGLQRSNSESTSIVKYLEERPKRIFPETTISSRHVEKIPRGEANSPVFACVESKSDVNCNLVAAQESVLLKLERCLNTQTNELGVKEASVQDKDLDFDVDNDVMTTSMKFLLSPCVPYGNINQRKKIYREWVKSSMEFNELLGNPIFLNESSMSYEPEKVKRRSYPLVVGTKRKVKFLLKKCSYFFKTLLWKKRNAPPAISHF